MTEFHFLFLGGATALLDELYRFAVRRFIKSRLWRRVVDRACTGPNWERNLDRCEAFRRRL